MILSKPFWSRMPVLLLLASSSTTWASLLRVTDSEVSSDAARHTLHIDLPPVEMDLQEVFGVEWVRYSVDGQSMLCKPGAPELPLVTQLIEIPDRADVHVRVIRGESELVYHSLFYPAQETLHQEFELPLPWQQDLDLYATNAYYPAEPATISDPALMRNRRLISLQLAPVQVNPVTGEARVWHSLDLELTFSGENPINQRVIHLNDRQGPLDHMIDMQVFNPATEEGAMESAYHNPGTVPGRYLVFVNTTAQSNAGYVMWKQWKLDRGFRITEVTQQNISFTASNIRNRIISEYQSNDPIDFVILIGDTDGSFAIPSGSTDYDQYYSAIEGNDILGDVAVGRISVDNASQLASVMNKIVTYESDPLQAGDSWLNGVGFTVGSDHCHLSMKTLTRSIVGEMVEQRSIDDVDTCMCCGSSHVDDWFNAGIAFYNYRGYVGMEELSCSDVQNLNQGPRYPVVTIFTCGTGDFISGDDFTECFLRAPGGAVASMGFATLGTHTAYNNVICGGYYGGFLDYHIPYIGSCLIQGEFELWQNLPAGDSHAASFANWANLMGDPGTTMWLGTPGEFDTVLPDEIDVNNPGLELILSSDGVPVSEVAVCLYQENFTDELQLVEMSDENGRVFFDLSDIDTGSLQITMYHQLYAPVSQSVDVVAGLGLTLAGWSFGSNDHIVPGTSDQTLSLTLRNEGASTLEIDNVFLSLAEEFGTLSGTPSGSITLAPDGDTILDGYTLSVPQELADGQVLPLQLSVVVGTSTHDYRLPLVVGSALPEIRVISFPAGSPDPGDTAEVVLRVENVGSQTDDLSFTLEGLIASMVSVEDTLPITVNAFAPGDYENLSFTVSLSDLAVPGMQAPMRLSWVSGSLNMLGSTELSLDIGTPTANDPTGPDSYGYWAFEDLDTGYDMAPEYEWVEIVPQNGGSGERLDIYDGGNEQDDALWMDLPFTFTFYGQDYDRVFVCSNGFISFAENGFGEVDFRNHYFPSAIGPDAMIAPMWDDHLTGSTSTTNGVYYWYDEEMNRAVFTWNNLSANSSGGPNTFQLLLNDPAYYPTITGDGSFLFQYADFNDNQNASTDFPYCSVGIKNHESNVGLNLLNYHVLNSTMHSIADGRAILLTTTLSGALSPPELGISMESVSVSFYDEGEQSVDLLLENLGQMPLVWSAHLENPSRDSGGPDSFGYTWKDNAEADGPEFNWVDHEADGHAVTFAHHDSCSALIDPGMFVHLYGRRCNDFRISPNGYIAFSDGDAYPNNTELPSASAPEFIVAGWWDNLKPEPNTAGYCWWWSDGSDSLVVTWQDVPHYNPFSHGGPFTFQIIMHRLGEITLQVLNTDSEIYDEGDSGTIGIQGTTTEGLTLLYNESIADREPWCATLTPPGWVSLPIDAEGILWDGESTTLPLTFTSSPGFLVPDGEYNMSLVISINSTEQPNIVVPLSMNVSTDVSHATLPTSTRLCGAWPNPFNPSTRIAFELAQAGPVSLRVYNLRGQLVGNLLAGQRLPAGEHEVVWEAANLASGMYIMQLHADGVQEQMKLMLMK